MERILNLFSRFPEIEEDAKTAFANKLQILELDRGDLVEKAGEVCDHLYLVAEGSLRSYYYKDNKDITVSFALEGEFTTSMYSFISRQPGYENIEAMESSTVGKISHSELKELFETHPISQRPIPQPDGVSPQNHPQSFCRSNRFLSGHEHRNSFQNPGKNLILFLTEFQRN